MAFPISRDVFEQITSSEGLFAAWETFQRGKRSRQDVQRFWRRLESNIFALRRELLSGAYQHGSYESFFVNDPKPRHIRKAQVRDRIVHQALYSVLSQLWERRFIHDVYSARLGKGTHFGVNRLWMVLRRVSRNFTSACWVLKCDIRKLYDSMDHRILISLIRQRVSDDRAMRVVEAVVSSFHTEGHPGKGIPIGNVTSQIFTNIYLNELDQFVKQELRVRLYGRFSDDFVLVSPRRSDLLVWRTQIEDFLDARLRLSLHPHKVSLRPLHQGIDFLGYVLLPHHRGVRSSTRRRMFRRLEHKAVEVFRGKAESGALAQAVASYLGMLSHANTFDLQRTIENSYGGVSEVENSKAYYGAKNNLARPKL
jgi:RNA-directed DNA polymerase